MTQNWARLAALIVGFWATSGQGEGIELTLSYGVYAKGFKGLNVEVEIGAEETRYSARLDSQTAGVVSWFSDWQMRAESVGVLDGVVVAPTTFKTRNQRGDTVRRLEITYVEDKSLTVLSQPSAGDDDRPQVGPEMTIGTIDPLSALVGALLATADGQICPGTLAIFDGRRRYDLLSTALEVRRFPGGGIAPYSGDAFGCRIEFAQLAGFKETEADNRDVLNSRLDVWLADVGGNAVLVPTRLEMRGKSGRVLVHLQRVRDRRGLVVFGES